jgi:predicted dehydrogenase
MKPLRFALFGAGFWARYQLAAWREVPGAQCIAVCDRTLERAKALGIPKVYSDPQELLRAEQPDFIDIVTDVGSHASLVALAASQGISVICQKPMACTLEEAESMVRSSLDANVPFLVHENWRWQAPIREIKRELEKGTIGRPFRARIQFSSDFPVFENQPGLRGVEEFIVADVGSHLLDVARFLFGEARSVACHTIRVREDIRGEDVATILLRMESGTAVVVELSYASRLRDARFPETYLTIEGDRGSLELGPGSVLHVSGDRPESRPCPSPHYSWADPAYDLVHASIVPCHADLLRALKGAGSAETTGLDNLNTVRLVFAAYESARTGRTVELGGPHD